MYTPRLIVGALAASCTTVGPARPDVPEPAAVVAVAEVPAPPEEVAAPPPRPAAVADRELVLKRQPDGASPTRGILAPDVPFPILQTQSGPGCSDPWAQVSGGAWVCQTHTSPTSEPPELVPQLVAFDPPEPDEWEPYRSGEGYDRDPVDQAESLLPFIYGKPYRRTWSGKLYASAEAFARGDAPTGTMNRGDHKYSFVRAIDTERGTVIARADGTVAAADDVFFYPVDRFSGRDLVADPAATGTVAGWAIGYEGSKMYAAPGDERAEPARIVAYHEAFDVTAVPATEDAHWWEIPDGMGPGIPGYMIEDFDYPSFRRVDLGPLPEGISGDEVWIDIHLRQQVLVLYRGATPQFATMVSSGAALPTPVGMFRIYDKYAYGDMEGRPDADYEPYLVENVPWVMHFAPRYALHGAFWHWGFGHVASHGCVNLAPKDAQRLYEAVSPERHEGWLASMEAPEDPGTLVRIRRDNPTPRDRRKPLQ